MVHGNSVSCTVGTRDILPDLCSKLLVKCIWLPRGKLHLESIHLELFHLSFVVSKLVSGQVGTSSGLLYFLSQPLTDVVNVVPSIARVQK